MCQLFGGHPVLLLLTAEAAGLSRHHIHCARDLLRRSLNFNATDHNCMSIVLRPHLTRRRDTEAEVGTFSIDNRSVETSITMVLVSVAASILLIAVASSRADDTVRASDTGDGSGETFASRK